jgi:serine/threonine protein kinase/tetratricopeptide (TPR) repeat protein/TolB-like protein
MKKTGGPKMISGDWRQIKEILAAALECKTGERSAYLQKACGDPAVRREVQSLLAAHEEARDTFLQAPAVDCGSLDPGTNLGHYRIAALLGAGGMGEVYQAHDTQLGRDVAIKILPPPFVHDAERLARFQREARTLASLNHPNIATIFGLEQCDEMHYLVMELVPGRTLADRLRADPPDIAWTLAISVQIADGLQAAHSGGVIHRDLKPANVKVTPDGRVKILDFGLAKIFSGDIQRDLLHGPTLTTVGGWRMLGTPAYMSPEQARGERADRRTDVWAFGCVLYELLTARRAFRGNTVADTIAAVLDENPDWNALPPSTPASIRDLVQRCLEKNPDHRLLSIAEARDAIVQVQHNAPDLSLGPTSAPAIHRLGVRLFASGLLLLLVLGISLTAIPGFRKHILGWIGVSPIPQDRQLAVLPFEVVGADPNTKALADGLSETLTAKLTQLTASHALQVVPAGEIRGRQVSSSETARQELGVNLILTGSLQRSGGLERVTYELVDTRTRRQLRADTITIPASDLFAGEDQVVESVVRMLDLELQPDERQNLRSRDTQVVDAYDLYLQGRGYLQDYDRVENLQNAINSFQRALATDPKYALAYTGLGQAYWLKYQESKDTKWVLPAREACEHALGFDERLAPAHVCLGTLDSGTGQYERAVSEFERALEAEPTSDDAYRALAEAYQHLGNVAEAEKTYRRAIELRPHYWAGYNWLGAFYFNQSRFPEAVAMFNQVVALVPDSFRGSYNLGAALNGEGRYQEAVAAIQHSIEIRPTATAYTNLGNAYFWKRQYEDAVHAYEGAIKLKQGDYVLWSNMGDGYYWNPARRTQAMGAYRQAIMLGSERLSINPKDQEALGTLAICHAMLGEKGPALKFLRQGLKLAPESPGILFKAALVYNQFGDENEALVWLSKALAAGYSATIVRDSPNFDLLRSDYRFQELTQAK